MARITFEIDDQIKHEIKIRLAKEGQTFSDIMRVFCSYYRDFGLYPGGHVRWENRDCLPDSFGVYFIYTKEGELQYVGQSRSLYRRLLSGHHCEDQFAEMGASIFFVETPDVHIVSDPGAGC